MRSVINKRDSCHTDASAVNTDIHLLLCKQRIKVLKTRVLAQQPIYTVFQTCDYAIDDKMNQNCPFTTVFGTITTIIIIITDIFIFPTSSISCTYFILENCRDLNISYKKCDRWTEGQNSYITIARQHCGAIILEFFKSSKKYTN